jgi:hypothetical protein
MKKLNCFFLLAILSLPLAGQRNADYGVFGGVSSYMGDINPGKLLYAPLPAAGVFYRYNLHPRESIRTNLFFGGVRAADSDFKNDFQQTRAKIFPGFKGEVGELAAQFEFNFLPYSTQGKRWNYTPYFAAGVGVAFINTLSFAIQPVIPFSLGFKINAYKNFGLEAEYGFRKTFYDNFDGLKDLVAPSDYGWLHNNDWYTFTGLALTWKFYNRLAGCPAYEDTDKKRKR